jgi:cytoskeletal protein RodZ
MSTGKPKTIKSKLKNFWFEYETKVVLVIGFILVAVISFEAGTLKGQKWQQKPLIIEKPAQISENNANKADLSDVENTQKVENQADNSQTTQNNSSQAPNLVPESVKTPDGTNISPAVCALVGSKKSTIYHKPTCQFAKHIKPENQVCFGSEEEAKSKGYSPCGTCFK